MDKPPQLKTDTDKSDIELKVTGGAPSEPSEVSENQLIESSTTPPTAESPTEKSIREAGEKINAQASRRSKEQEFLAGYKKKQAQTRLRFVVCAAIVLALYATALISVFNNNEKASTALARFQIVPVFACLGERDTAYYGITAFSDAKTKETPGLIEQRTKILDTAIDKMEENGRPAIFTRLGTESMLMRFGDRASGLKYGDALIARYPDLPSNYLWRAKTDLDNFDFASSIAEYKQAAKLLEHLPKSQARSWQSEFDGALWAAIDSGQIKDAKKFFPMYKENGGSTYDRQGLESRLLITSCENIAAPELRKTSFWNEKLNTAYKNRVEKALLVASQMDFREKKFDESPEFYQSQLLKQAMPLTNDEVRIKKWAGFYYSWDEFFNARSALQLNKPKEALTFLDGYKSDYDMGEAKFLEASALQKLHRSQEAIRIVDHLLQSHKQSEIIWRNHYLPLLTVKANALCDTAQYNEALALSDKILVQNPNAIEPLLIKLRCYKGLNDTSAAAQTSKAISNELSEWMNPIESDLHD
jgi:hypothetical protein